MNKPKAKIRMLVAAKDTRISEDGRTLNTETFWVKPGGGHPDACIMKITSAKTLEINPKNIVKTKFNDY